MSTNLTGESTRNKGLRLWPGAALALLLLAVRFVLPIVMPDAMIVAVLGGIAGGAAILLWWLFFSRAPWSERLGAPILMALALYVTSWLVHESIRGGMMGRMLPVFLGIPVLAIALVAWAAVSRGMSAAARGTAFAAAVLLACASLTLIRTDGILSDGTAQFAWRWTPTHEERLLAQTRDEPIAAARVNSAAAPVSAPAPHSMALPAAAPPSAAATATAEPTASAPLKTAPALHAGEAAVRADAAANASADPAVEWPGFRGAARDGSIRGVRIDTDWASSPPVELWRRPVGPGWSSFAVHGDVLYTQEQRGDDEVVAAYRMSTGEPVWRHSDPVRFYESNGGAGPRATPTLGRGRVYTLGATGMVNALDAATGAVVWSRNAASDTGAPMPGWGFSGSPLIVDDAVVVAASGRLVAYEMATGNPRWSAQTKGGSYSSPQLATIAGVRQIVMLSGFGATSVAPGDGTVLWQHEWAGTPIVQPALLPGGDILVSTADMMGGLGVRRLSVSHPDGWKIEERWTTRGLKPYFNDYVVNDGHAFGFDGRILSCISLEDGARKWKGGRYGQGQLVLLPDQDLLLVLSEDGELGLVAATADEFKELARFPALNGKTWNHPVLVGNVLLVRNGEEMVAFRLAAR